MIKEYKINISQAKLDDLHERLDNTSWPNVIKGNNYGGPDLGLMQTLAKKAKSFNWRKAEEQLNKLPNFTTEIDGQNIHFIHVRSAEPNATPVMLVHGWPGSVIEFLDVIEPLTKPPKGQPAFDVVIPSLPGFAFSGATKDQGWTQERMAAALVSLMDNLGYDKFMVQGGDAGAIIAPTMARLAPKKVIGVHVNAATVGFMPFGEVSEEEIASFTPSEKERLQRLQEFMQVKFGFNLLQSNQPQLVAYAVSDSPVGLMSWMSQLFPPEQLEEKFLLNFYIYWLTGTASSSMRMYYEDMHDPNAFAPKANSGVPTAVAVFQDADIALRKYGEDGNNIVRWTEIPKGGHFAALGNPAGWVKDVREFRESL